MVRIARALGIVASMLVITGCGGSDEDGGASGSGGDGEDVTRSTLASGETATFQGPNGKLDVKIGADAVEGSIDDLKEFRLEEDEKSMTPWYVTRTVENAGDEITADDAFTGLVDVFDDTGAEPKKLALLGDFEQCKLVNAPDPFPAGESFTSCNVYLVDEGRTLAKLVVEDTQFEGPSREFTWKVD